MKSFNEWKNKSKLNECACGCNSDPATPCTCGCQSEDNEMEMHLKNLRIIAHYAKSIHDMIENGQDLEEWQQHKISVCRAYISDVKHAFD